MKNGYTTGSCAAAAARAATLMLLSKKKTGKIVITTPAGVIFDADIEDADIKETSKDGHVSASCAVRKDAGDDPDVTNNMLIYARVLLINDGMGRVETEGGEGIGKVTRPGLDQPVGQYAINSVPRMMIENEVRSVMEEYGYEGSAKVTIYAPEGKDIAAKTFNPRLGIEGGISIIGTSGIVEPMSTKAVIDTIRVELRQKREMGKTIAVVSPGNYGLDFMKDNYGYDLNKATKCSNYIGETIDIAKSLGYSGLLIVGHAGKLIKLAGGIMNTHSKEADCRMELMAASAARSGADAGVIKKILDCVSTDEAYACLIEAHIEKECFSYIMDRIAYYLDKRADGMKIGCIVYSNTYGALGKTEMAEELLEEA